MIRSLAFGLLGTTILVAACAGPMERRSSIRVAPARDFASARARAADEMRAGCHGATAPAEPSDDLARRRNRLVGVSIAAMDEAYEDYRRRLLGSSRRGRGGFADSPPEMHAIEGAATDLSRAMNVTQGAVAGIHGRAGRHRLRELLLAMLVEQMDANRAVQRTAILRRLRMPVGEWNICIALADLAAYEQAGTLNAALAALAASAAEASRSARSALESGLRGRED
jgi:hypothetical protein